MTFNLGLTGSIGMGKSTTAKMFEEEGCALWDADVAVHRLYAKGGAAVAPMGQLFSTSVQDGAVSRDALKAIIADDPTALARIEAVVHPLVAQDRSEFIAAAKSTILVFDIPLLFETGGDSAMDAVAVVYVDANTQKKRVMERGTMSEAQFQAILAKQMPSVDKCKRADFVIKTDTVENARAQVHSIVQQIKNRL